MEMCSGRHRLQEQNERLNPVHNSFTGSNYVSTAAPRLRFWVSAGVRECSAGMGVKRQQMTTCRPTVTRLLWGEETQISSLLSLFGSASSVSERTFWGCYLIACDISDLTPVSELSSTARQINSWGFLHVSHRAQIYPLVDTRQIFHLTAASASAVVEKATQQVCLNSQDCNPTHKGTETWITKVTGPGVI